MFWHGFGYIALHNKEPSRAEGWNRMKVDTTRLSEPYGSAINDILDMLEKRVKYERSRAARMKEGGHAPSLMDAELAVDGALIETLGILRRSGLRVK